MKIKSLAIVAATLAATVVSSQAQVYSQNIVGYVNVVLKGTNSYTLICNPLDDGNGNAISNLFAALPAGSSVTTWNGATFNAPVQKTVGGWPATAGAALPPGVGFFLKNGKASPSSPDYTNTFAGTVAVNSGGSVTNSLIFGYSLVGSILPYAGDLITDTNLNLQVAKQSTLTAWDVNGQVYTAPIQKTVNGWPVGAVFPVTVGQGYFIKSGVNATNWIENAPF
jgi:hypothetical protein